MKIKVIVSEEIIGRDKAIVFTDEIEICTGAIMEKKLENIITRKWFIECLEWNLSDGNKNIRLFLEKLEDNSNLLNKGENNEN